MYRKALLLLVAVMSACAGNQPLRVDCESRLVRINGPVEQIDDAQRELQPEEDERRP
jgi:hypothetical protein